jgi:hypothetical protein
VEIWGKWNLSGSTVGNCSAGDLQGKIQTGYPMCEFKIINKVTWREAKIYSLYYAPELSLLPPIGSSRSGK